MTTRQKSSSARRSVPSPSVGRVRATGLLLFTSGLLLLFAAAVTAHASLSLARVALNELVAQDELDEVSLILGPEGFTPGEVRRPAGRFMLSVDNRSGLNNVTFVLRRGDGNKVLEIKVSDRHGDWSEMIELQPGKYTFSEVSHPDWKCSFLVNEKK